MTYQLDMLDWIETYANSVVEVSPSFPKLELTRIDPAKNMRRFYKLHIEYDLFGTVLLARQYGRIGAPRGRIRFDAFPTEAEAHQAFTRLQKQKERRGYRLS